MAPPLVNTVNFFSRVYSFFFSWGITYLNYIVSLPFVVTIPEGCTQRRISHSSIVSVGCYFPNNRKLREQFGWKERPDDLPTGSGCESGRKVASGWIGWWKDFDIGTVAEHHGSSDTPHQRQVGLLFASQSEHKTWLPIIEQGWIKAHKLLISSVFVFHTPDLTPGKFFDIFHRCSYKVDHVVNYHRRRFETKFENSYFTRDVSSNNLSESRV